MLVVSQLLQQNNALISHGIQRTTQLFHISDESLLKLERHPIVIQMKLYKKSLKTIFLDCTLNPLK